MALELVTTNRPAKQTVPDSGAAGINPPLLEAGPAERPQVFETINHAGIICPDYETAIAILRKHYQSFGLDNRYLDRAIDAAVRRNNGDFSYPKDVESLPQFDIAYFQKKPVIFIYSDYDRYRMPYMIEATIASAQQPEPLTQGILYAASRIEFPVDKSSPATAINLAGIAAALNPFIANYREKSLLRNAVSGAKRLPRTFKDRSLLSQLVASESALYLFTHKGMKVSLRLRANPAKNDLALHGESTVVLPNTPGFKREYAPPTLTLIIEPEHFDITRGYGRVPPVVVDPKKAAIIEELVSEGAQALRQFLGENQQSAAAHEIIDQ